MKSFKKIIAFVASFAIVVSISAVPVFATETSQPGSTFWDFLAWSSADSSGGGSFFQYIGSLVSDSVCPTSPDSFHHGNIVSIQRRSVPGSAYAVNCICDYCGDEFSTFVNDTQLSAAYDDYVSTLPASGYQSDGKLIWYPDIVPQNDGHCPKLLNFYCSNLQYSFYVDGDGIAHCSRNPSSTPVYSITSDCINFFGQHNANVTSGSSAATTIIGYQDICPVSGSYQFVVPAPTKFKYQDPGTMEWHDYASVSTGFSSRTDILTAGSNFSYGGGGSIYWTSSHSAVFVHGIDVSIPRAYCIITPSTSVADTYIDNSRVGSFVGDYIYEGDGGTQIVAENVNFFDEVNNTFYDPQTDETVAIESWSYDYISRSYRLYDGNGDLVVVTYADSGVTVQEGDTINNYYYAVPDDDPGGDDDPPSEHSHNWDNGITTTAASCLMPGVITYTCSGVDGCNATRTESIPALGHSWVIHQQVATEYDSSGELVTQGYVIYQCSRCEEQYRSDSGVPPPSGEDSTEITLDKPSFLLWLWAAIKNILVQLFDGLGGLLDFFLGNGDSQNSLDFYNSPSTFSGHSVWD